MSPRPNIVIILSDQHRAEATGYAGNPDVRTPHLDALSAEAVDFETAVVTIPCCSPSRASLITGRLALTHGVFVNDVTLGDDAVSIAQAFASAGYDTAYIGKWHLNGKGRSSYIPPEERQGFQYWKALECTHDYNSSAYYADADVRLAWDGYDAQAQTADAEAFIRAHSGSERPFLLVLAWGPPHNPYDQAPEAFRSMYDPARLSLRPNVPSEAEAAAREDLAGYYAHISALDQCLGSLTSTLDELGLGEDTILLYTSDHGDMLGSQGEARKQRPWDESIRVPFLLRYPRVLGRAPRSADSPITSADVMPTLLGLSRLSVPCTVEGTDFSPFLTGEAQSPADAALLACIQPSGEYRRALGGREYRGIRTSRHTYVRDLEGPWLLYDNDADPYQLANLVGDPDSTDLRSILDSRLDGLLHQARDPFLPGEAYVQKWGYQLDETGTVPYTP